VVAAAAAFIAFLGAALFFAGLRAANAPPVKEAAASQIKVLRREMAGGFCMASWYRNGS